jgi:hypothetical protein
LKKFICGPKGTVTADPNDAVSVTLFGCSDLSEGGSVGDAIRNRIRRAKLQPASHAWDFLSLALSVIAADYGGSRKYSPDGWTREFELQVAVNHPEFWSGQHTLIEKLLGFLSTDIWHVKFTTGGFVPLAITQPIAPAMIA